MKKILYVMLTLSTMILICATIVWTKSSHNASDKTINDLGEFYLEEITERNTRTISSELKKKTEQMNNALSVLNEDYLNNEDSIRQYISMVQKINGIDMFALVDDKGMVYTADSTFSGIYRFSFLSKEITDTQIHVVKSYGTGIMIIIAVPVVCETSSGIRVVSCFTGLNVENIISAEQLQSDDNKSYCRLFTKDGENLISMQGDY